jgi:hypothetical protein
MKKQLLSIFAVAVLNTVANAQCSTTFQTTSNCSYDHINTFTLGGVASVGNDNTYGVCNSNGYYQFANPLRTLKIGSTITWSATVANGHDYDGIGIWIDLNNDNEYSSSEFVSASSPSTPNTFSPSGSFVMPTGVTGTILSMRVRSTYAYVPTAGQACTNGIGNGGNAGYGETEDYFVMLSSSLNTPTFNELVYKIYPNPSNSIFTIEIDKNALIEVYDLVGKQIVTKNIFTGTNTLDISSYENGVYFAKITNTDNQTQTVKLIKE